MQHMNTARSGIRPAIHRPARVSKPGLDQTTEMPISSRNWVIMACRQDEDVVGWILTQAESLGVTFGRVIWVSDDGPLRFFGAPGELWDYLSSHSRNRMSLSRPSRPISFVPETIGAPVGPAQIHG
jgi:hypothetical protein